MMRRKWVALMLCGVLCFGMAGCGGEVPAGDLTSGVTPSPVTEKETDGTFEGGYMRFATELFKAEAAGKDSNVLVSPLSVQLALAMTANGAAGDTLTEMEQVLGGGIPIDDLNGYLHTVMQTLSAAKESRLQLANSIWLRDEEGLTVEPAFLQTNADYYNAPVYKRPFNSDTVEEINRWVNENTDGTIDRIVDDISADSMLYLINALVFDAKWDEPYLEKSIREGIFTTANGKEQTVDMMRSTESGYLDDGKATGFMKYYEGYDYSFAALLPNEGVDIHDYVAGLTATGLRQTLLGADDDAHTTVMTYLPKFSYDYSASLRNTLCQLGMPTAFDAQRADFSAMAELPLYIGDVKHKTFITVDALGTKAGAATSVEIKAAGLPAEPQHTVTLDRPFVYMIVHNATNLPVFIGTVLEIE